MLRFTRPLLSLLMLAAPFAGASVPPPNAILSLADFAARPLSPPQPRWNQTKKMYNGKMLPVERVGGRWDHMNMRPLVQTIRGHMLVDNGMYIELSRAFPEFVNIPQQLYLTAHQSTVSMMAFLRSSEMHIMYVMLAVLQSQCTGDGPPLFIDSGMNEGTWSVLAAKSGCCAIGVEPQPLCHDLMELATARNGPPVSTNLFHIKRLLSSTRIEMNVPYAGAEVADFNQCRGGYGGHGLAPPKSTAGEPTERVGSIDLDSVLLFRKGARKNPEMSAELLEDHPNNRDHNHVCGPARWHGKQVALWHVDVEGAEVLVAQSATSLFRSGRIERVMMEVNGGDAWRKRGISKEVGRVQMAQLFSNFTCVVMCNHHEYSWMADVRGICKGKFKGVVSPVDVYCVLKSLAAADVGLAAIRRFTARAGDYQ